MSIDDLSRGQLAVDWTLVGFGDGELGVCADLGDVAEHVHDLVVLDGGDARGRPLRKDPDDEDCWRVPAGRSEGGARRLRYRYDLAALARDSGDPDRAWGRGGDWIFSDGAVLLRPEPLVRGAPIAVELRLPPNTAVAAAWPRAPEGGPRFRFDADTYDGTSYVAIGRLTPLGEMQVHGGAVAISTFDRGRRAGIDILRDWVGRAATAVAKLYGALPGGRAEVVLVPVPGSSRGGIFGTVRHRVLKTVVLYFGADADGGDFTGDWVAPHELLHVGSPVVRGRLPWLVEGFATYYQDVIRARSGARSAVDMWEDLEDFCRRFGDGKSSLAEESRELGRRHHYQRVYWGGACLALRVDVAARKSSGGRRSLDDVMRALLAAGDRAPLDEDAIVAALDRAAGRPIARAHLDATTPLGWDELFRDLGVRRSGSTVTLDDSAPLAAVRRAIF